MRVPRDGAFALFVASGSGYIEIARLILSHGQLRSHPRVMAVIDTRGCVSGADVNLKNKQGATALSYATMR